ncbi:MAG: hypothetical protein RJA07_247 [Bacteroidota bacterium]|jgi:hypothetical protein
MKSIIAFLFLLFFSATIFAQTNCMNIGINLSTPAYYEYSENPFLDQIKLNGDFFSCAISGGAFNTNHANQFTYDADGYCTCGIPFTTTGGSEKLRFMVSASGRLKQEQYVFLYDGTGTFSFSGFVVDTLQPNRIVVTCNTSNNVWIDINTSNPSPSHVRNFRLIPKAYEFNYQQHLFRQNFIDKVSNFYSIRFMQSCGVIGSNQIQWADRVLPTTFSQGATRGMAYEYAIDLCNQVSKHPWVCVPHLADSNYVVQMATLFKNNLNSNLNIYVEYSNEVWNYGYTQAHWITQDTANYPSSWPKNNLYDASKSQPYNAGKLAARVFKIWRNVFGADSLRVKRVLTCQAANSWVGSQNSLGANHQYDYLSPSFYFDVSTAQANAFTASTTPQQIIDTCRYNFFVKKMASIKNHYAIAKADGAEVIHYEGGQHITANGNASNPALQAMYAAQLLPEMYQLYDDVLDSIRSWGSTLAVAYSLGSGDSKYGSWGHIRSVDSVSSMIYSPKFEALLNNLPSKIAGCQLGIDEQNKVEAMMNVFPNPASEWLIVNGKLLNGNTIVIYDLMGRACISIVNHTSEIVNIEHLPSGIYFLKTTDGNGFKHVAKFVKE